MKPAQHFVTPIQNIQAGASDLFVAASRLPTATLHEAAGKIGALPSIIKPVAPSFRCAGRALTVDCPPGDNLWIHRALEIAQPGDVLVIHTHGAYEFGYWGEIMSTMAHKRGLAGMVIDGCVRDAVLLQQIGLPVFARGLCIRGTGKDFNAIGWINQPVTIGQVLIQAGDLIVGDADGVVVIPRDCASAAVTAAQQREIEESRILQRLIAGESTMDIYQWRRTIEQPR